VDAKNEISDWIVSAALAGPEEIDIVAGVCEQLIAAGVSVVRASAAGISDTTNAATVLALLNDYAEAQVDEIEGHGGHVLKFTGDGILAIFPHDDTPVACKRALDAATGQRSRIAKLNAQRSAGGLPVTDTHVALHVGELLYGNLGSARRLDFTVLGPAVNEAARIESLCGSLEQPIIVSSAFAESAGDTRGLLVSLGRYAMKGVAKPQELFTVDLG